MLDLISQIFGKQIVPLIWGLLNYRALALYAASALSLVVWIWVFSLPSEFGAKTRVYVDTDSLLRPLLSGLTVNSDVMSDVQVMTRALKARPQLERLARETDLDLQAKTPADFEGLLVSLSERIEIVADGQNSYAISYVDTDRDRALRVTKQLLNNFVEDTVGTGQEDSQQAAETLQKEIADYERRLTEAELRLAEFKQKNVGLMPNDRGGYYEQLQAAMVDLQASEAQLRKLTRRVAALQGQLEGEEPVFGIMPHTRTSSPSIYDGQIKALEERLAQAKIEYTDRHPEVLRTESLLAELHMQREEELAKRPLINPETGSLDLNPVYQSLRIQLNDAEVEAASMQAAVIDRRAEVERLRELVDVVPEVEAELNRLNRDYTVVSNRYQEMLDRWEALQTSQRVRTGTNRVQFRIIEPPFAAMEPVGPPRGLYLVFGLFVSLGFGTAVAGIRHFLEPAIHTVDQLHQLLNRPILGTISTVSGDGVLEQPRTRTMFFLVGVVFLVVASLSLSLLAEPTAQLLQRLIYP